MEAEGDRAQAGEKSPPFIELLKPDQWLSFTYNPCDAHQFYGKPGRTVLIVKHIESLLKAKLPYWCRYEVYPEYSFNGKSVNMSKGPRLHYHGIIQITDLIYLYELGYNELQQQGVFEIDTIDDIDVWMRYCKKSETVIKPLCKQLKIPYKLSSEKKIKQKKSMKERVQQTFDDFKEPSGDIDWHPA